MNIVKNLNSETFFLTVGVFSVTALTNVIIYNGVKSIINRNKPIVHINSNNSINSQSDKDDDKNNDKNDDKDIKKVTKLEKCFIINSNKVVYDFTCAGCVIGTIITFYNSYKQQKTYYI